MIKSNSSCIPARRDQIGASRASQCVVLSSIEDSLGSSSQILDVLSVREKDVKLTELDEQISPAFSLPDGQGHDTANVVILRAPFLLTEVTDKVCSKLVDLGHDVE